jgi:hypothetical protein
MNEQTVGKPDYGNWVSKRLIFIPGVIGLVFLGLALFFPILLVLALPFMVGTIGIIAGEK